MSEDLTLKISADVSDVKRGMSEVVSSAKQVERATVDAGEKSAKSMEGFSRKITLAAGAMIGFRLATRAAREVMEGLEEAAGKNSLVSGSLKDAAVVAASSVENLSLTFSKFKQTAVSAVAPVIGYIAEDLSGSLRKSTQDMKDNAETVEDLAVGYGVLKTVIGAVGGTFQMVFAAMQAAIADVLIIVGKLSQGFAFLAGVISKDVGDSIKQFGDTMVASADAVGDKAIANMEAGGRKLGKALSGAMFEETMTGFEKYRKGVESKAADLIALDKAMANLENKKAEGEALDKAAEAIRKRRELLPEIQLEMDIEKQILDIKTKQKKEAWEAHLARTEDTKYLELQNLLEAEKFKEISKQVAEMEKLEKAQQAASEARNANYQEKAGKLYSGEVSAPALKIEQTDTEKEYFKSRLELELEFYTSSVENANAYATEILAIDDYLNGTIQEQEGRRRAQELIAERKNAQLKKMTWQDAAQAAGGIFDNLAVLMQSKNRQMFEVGKVAAQSSNALHTIESAAAAYKWGTEFGGPLGPALGAAWAATAVVAGLVRAQQIQSTQFGGGGNVSAGGGSGAPTGTSNSAPTGPSPGSTSTVNVSMVGDRFGASQVRGLIDMINAEAKDGKRITKVNIL